MTRTTKHILTLFKRREKYVFIYQSTIELLQKCEQFANNPELSFDWQDVGVVADKVASGEVDRDWTRV